MGQTLVVSQAQISDAETITGIINEAWPDDPVDVQRVKTILARGDHLTLIARIDGVPAAFVDGFYTTSVDGLRRWELDLLATVPALRGWGAAPALIRASVEAVRDADFVRALTRTNNSAVHRALEKCGFRANQEVHCLWVGDASPSDESHVPAAAFITVQTLTYDGVWVEAVHDIGSLHAGRSIAQGQGVAIAGAVIPLSNRAGQAAAEECGYTRIGEYQWWMIPV